MADYQDDLGRLESQFAGLEGSIAGLEGVSAAFRQELAGVQGGFQETGREASSLSRSMTSTVRQAFNGLIFDGKRVSDALSGVGRGLANSVLNQALSPVQNAIGSALGTGVQSLISGVLPFAKGGAFSGGRVAAFARGGIVDGPTHFPMRGGVGLMGEAGPEAIVPLARGSDGKLGIRTGGGAKAINVTMNISTPDATGFQRSQTQIAAEMNRAIQRGQRNL